MNATQLKHLLETQVFDVEDAATYLGLRPNSVEIAAIRGRIPFVHWSHKKLFTKEDLDYYAAHRATGRASRLHDVAVIEVKKR
jgi:hypothetical protein